MHGQTALHTCILFSNIFVELINDNELPSHDESNLGILDYESVTTSVKRPEKKKELRLH